MLDCYLIPDNEPAPEFPDESKFIGGVNIQDFSNIEGLKQYAAKFDLKMSFHSDFRISNKILLKLISFNKYYILEVKDKKIANSYLQIQNIFEKAVESNSGLYFFSD